MPFTFTDAKDRTWNVELDLLKVQQIDSSDYSLITKTQILLSSFDKQVIAEVLSNTSLMFAVIWTIVRDQAEKNGISPKETDLEEDDQQHEFMSGIKGDTIEKARIAFLESLGDFFRDHQTALSMLSRKLTEMKEKMVEKAPRLEKMIDQLTDQEFDRMLDEAQKRIDERAGTLSTN